MNEKKRLEAAEEILEILSSGYFIEILNQHSTEYAEPLGDMVGRYWRENTLIRTRLNVRDGRSIEALNPDSCEVSTEIVQIPMRVGDLIPIAGPVPGWARGRGMDEVVAYIRQGSRIKLTASGSGEINATQKTVQFQGRELVVDSIYQAESGYEMTASGHINEPSGWVWLIDRGEEIESDAP